MELPSFFQREDVTVFRVSNFLKNTRKKEEEKELLLSRNNYMRLLQLQILTKTCLLRAEIFSLPSASPFFSLFFFLDIYAFILYI